MAEETKRLSNINLRIEGTTAVWEMREEGDINGTHTGTFKFRCFLSPTQKIAANREFRELLGPNPTMAPEHESFMAYALTQLKYRVLESPPFWSATKQDGAFEGDIPDETIIGAVLNAAVESELRYKDSLKQKKDDILKRAIKAAEAQLLKKDEDKSEEDAEAEVDEE